MLLNPSSESDYECHTHLIFSIGQSLSYFPFRVRLRSQCRELAVFPNWLIQFNSSVFQFYISKHSLSIFFLYNICKNVSLLQLKEHTSLIVIISHSLSMFPLCIKCEGVCLSFFFSIKMTQLSKFQLPHLLCLSSYIINRKISRYDTLYKLKGHNSLI